jgi:hypothetical protein
MSRRTRRAPASAGAPNGTVAVRRGPIKDPVLGRAAQLAPHEPELP